jgi:hypothetical protein
MLYRLSYSRVKIALKKAVQRYKNSQRTISHL